MMINVLNTWALRAGLLFGLLASPVGQAATQISQVLSPPFPYSNSPDLIETPSEILMVWSSGARPGYSDVTIQSSHWNGKYWSAPKQVTAYVEKRSGLRKACWKPVLVQGPRRQLALFYQVGDNRESWTGHVKFSYDGGHSWTPSKKLPRGFHGSINGKPVELPSGKLLCPSGDASAGWRVQMEFANPFRETWGWRKTKPLNFPAEYRATDPVVLMHSNTHIQVLCRTKQGYMTEIWTEDGTTTWQPMKRASLPNPNSAFDVVKMYDNRFVIVYNHSSQFSNRMNLAISENGTDWEAVDVLDQSTSEHFTNPSIIQAESGRLHVVYAVNQTRFRYLQLDPTQFETTPIVDGIWPVK